MIRLRLGPSVGNSWFAALGVWLAASCGGGSAPTSTSADFAPGSSESRLKADGSGLFFADPHFGGQAEAFRIVEVEFGRLVDVYDHDDSVVGAPRRTLQYREFLVGQDIASDGLNFEVETNPVSGATRLTVLRANDRARGDDEFDQLLELAAENAISLPAKGPQSVPPFPLWPRNAALSVRFSDLLDPDSVTSETVRVAVGRPPTEPFPVRVLPDPNHGGEVGAGGDLVFRTTRVLIDPALSTLEAAASDPPLVPNALGLPESLSSQQASVLLRIPSAIHFPSGQFRRLENLSRRGISAAESFNGPVDTSVPTRDVIRAFRAGNADDTNSGFLVDLTSPRVVGELAVAVVSSTPDPAADLAAGTDFVVSWDFDSPACALLPREGDVLDLPGGLFGVLRDGPAPQSGGVSDVRVRALDGLPKSATSLVGSGVFLTPFDPLDGDPPACFVTVVPRPALPPAEGVSPDSFFRVRFSEPMDPDSVSAFDTFMLSAKATDPLPREIVAARVLSSGDLRTFTLAGVLPLAHTKGSSEQYTLSMDLGVTQPSDLAGNALRDFLPQIAYKIETDSPSSRSGGYVLRFGERDEDGLTVTIDGQPFETPEIRGQFLYDFEAGVLRSRNVNRFQSVVDPSQPVVALMHLLPRGLQTPLSPLGSRLMSLWRYPDFSFTLDDETLYNIDVEGLSWAPNQGQLLADAFEEFQISLAHSNRLPDEFAPDGTSIPLWSDSGLMRGEWDTLGHLGNLLEDPLNNPMKVVHPKEKGYVIRPSDIFHGHSGTPFLPYPLNRGESPEDFAHYTWRDTAVLNTGAPEGGGADIWMLFRAGFIKAQDMGKPYGAGRVPSIGLPLLMDYRCYPSDTAIGLNAFEVSIAVNSSGQPNFRLFATGGININQDQVTKDPDTVPKPTGGFNPSNGGKGTKGFDNVVYHGAVDFVVRVSRCVTTWIDAGGPADWKGVVIEPPSSAWPSGTSIEFAYRGARSLAEQVPDAAKVAAHYDAYGNPKLGARFGQGVAGIDYFGGADWSADPSELQGARYLQVRLSLVGDAVSGAVPEVSALGIPFEVLP